MKSTHKDYPWIQTVLSNTKGVVRVIIKCDKCKKKKNLNVISDKLLTQDIREFVKYHKMT